MLTLHGEIVGQGRTLAVLPGGSADVYEQALAAQTLGTLTPLFKKSDPPGALLTDLAWPTIVQLARTYGEAWQPSPTLQAWIRREVLRRTEHADTIYRTPDGLVPYPWQPEGAAMIAATGRALITDEPGTGKTGTSVLGLVERWLLNPASLGAGPALVVCPASVVDSWVREWKMWAPAVPVVAWRGTPAKREALAGTAQVYVSSYDTVRADATEVKGHRPLLDLDFAHLIVDEVHFIKNPTAARTKAVLRIAAGLHRHDPDHTSVVALSGTPITRDTGDIFPALKALYPGAFPAKERMVGRYCMTVSDGDYEESILGLSPHTEEEFRLCLLGQHRRVKKADVLADLPPKVYTTRTVELPARWRRTYDDFEASMFAEMPDGTELSVMDAMSVYTHLSAMSSAPGTVRVEIGPDVDEKTGEPKRHVHIDLLPFDAKDARGSWKVGAVLELLEERRGRQTIVCAPSRQLMEVTGAAAAKAGYRVGYVVGGQSAAARTADVDAFQARELDVICVTTKAGGVGLTLTAADAVVFMQRPWELDESIQMEDRAHRIGADHESIQIIDIVAAGTIDERRRQALKGKVRQLAELVQDPRLAAELLGGKNVTERTTPAGGTDTTNPPSGTPRELISA